MNTEQLLAQLNEQQRKAVQHVDGPLLIIAGAGSGKTRVITYRVAYLLAQGIPSWNILAVTFTNKAAEEMRVRVHKLLQESSGQAHQAAPLVSTYHSFCVRVLRQDIEKLGYQRSFVIYDDDDSLRLIKQCLREMNLDEKKSRPREIASIIDKAKDDLLDHESYQIYASASQSNFRQVIGEIYRRYQAKLKSNNALDFGDLIMLTVQLWQKQPEVLKQYQDRFQYLMVDEYQDTNHAQYILTKMLAHTHKNICVVGDEDQSIYMFRGADIRNILDFEKDYQQCLVIKLEQNYRSTENILESAHKVIQNNRYRKDKELWTDNSKGDPVNFYQVANEIEEANFIAGEIGRLVREDIMPREIAVFYRTNAQSRVLEDAFRRANLPHMIVGGQRFYERREVKDILAYLRVIINSQDSLNLQRIINIPNRGIGKTSLDLIEKYGQKQERGLVDVLHQADLVEGLKDRVRTVIKQFLQKIDEWRRDKSVLSASELAIKVIEESGYIKSLEDGTDEGEGRVENVKELISAIKEFEEQSENKTLEAYLEQIALISDLDTWQQEKNYVTLMTLHLAKGLEFNHVFMVGLEEGLLPHINSIESEIELEEERRLCYVGMTRAKKRLVLTSAAERRMNGVRRWNIPSRFILEAELAENPAQESFTDNSQPFPMQSVPETNGFRRGQRIAHEVFGEGSIVEVSGSGSDQKVIVDFDRSGRKKLLVKAANLKKL